MRALIFAVTFLSAHVAHAQDPADLPLELYPLDDVSRTVEVKGRIKCPEVPLVPHRGEAVRWKTPLKVHPAFADRLERFEAIVALVATRIYGRAPTRITHLGSFNCRRIRRYPDLLSEHGIGNAIDVAAFEFPALARAEAKTSALPRALRRGFKASVLEHWSAEGDEDSPRVFHRRFLRELTAALRAHPEIFRVMLGPAYPGHKNHFHFDCAPYRLIDL